MSDTYVSSFKLGDITISLSNFIYLNSKFTRLECDGKEYVLVKFELNGREIYIPYCRNIADDKYWKACAGPALNRLIKTSETLMITDGWSQPLYRTSELLTEYSSVYGRGATLYLDVAPIEIANIIQEHPILSQYLHPNEIVFRNLTDELAKYGCLFLWAIGVLLLSNRYDSMKIISDVEDAKVFTMACLLKSIPILRDYRPEYEVDLPEFSHTSLLRCPALELVHEIFNESGVFPYQTEGYFRLISALKKLDQIFVSGVK